MTHKKKSGSRRAKPDKESSRGGKDTTKRKAATSDLHRMQQDHLRSGLTQRDTKILGREIASPSVIKHLLPTTFGKSNQSAIAAYVIPYWDPDGTRRDFIRLRLLDQYMGPGDKKPRKYMQPSGKPPQLYFSPLLKKPTWLKVLHDTSITLWITEGEKKGDAVCKLDVPCIALGGVRNWTEKGRNTLISDFDLFEWHDRKVKICFDSDFETNPNVRSALYALAEKLRERGAKVYAVHLPESGGAA